MACRIVYAAGFYLPSRFCMPHDTFKSSASSTPDKSGGLTGSRPLQTESLKGIDGERRKLNYRKNISGRGTGRSGRSAGGTQGLT